MEAEFVIIMFFYLCILCENLLFISPTVIQKITDLFKRMLLKNKPLDNSDRYDLKLHKPLIYKGVDI
jgi:hypothetical protein